MYQKWWHEFRYRLEKREEIISCRYSFSFFSLSCPFFFPLFPAHSEACSHKKKYILNWCFLITRLGLQREKRHQTGAKPVSQKSDHQRRRWQPGRQAIVSGTRQPHTHTYSFTSTFSTLPLLYWDTYGLWFLVCFLFFLLHSLLYWQSVRREKRVVVMVHGILLPSIYWHKNAHIAWV